MGKMDEPILVAYTEKLYTGYEEEDLQGFLPGDGEEFKNILERYSKNYGVMRRGEAEANADYKQIISYIVVRHGNELFTTRRLGSQGEKRLHGKLSVGIGGHMNYSPKEDFNEIIVENARRELTEELNIPKEYIDEVLFIGMVNNDAEEVGRHHIGLLGVLDVSDKVGISVRETEKMVGDWVDISELKEKGEELEDWSRIAVERLERM